MHWACALQLCMWLVLLMPFDGTFTPPQDLANHAGDDGNYGVSSDVTDLALHGVPHHHARRPSGAGHAGTKTPMPL